MTDRVDKYKQRSKNNFDRKAADYFNTVDGRYSLLMYGEVIEKINAHPFNSILDVGCGTGVMMARILNHHGHAFACGIDLSEKMIEQAEESLKGNAELVTGDSDNLPWLDDSFDTLVCNCSFHHFPEPIKVLLEMKRVLKPQGRIILADPWWSGIIRHVINLYLRSPFNLAGDYRIYSEKEIVEILNRCGFKRIKWHNPIGKYYILTATCDK